VASSCAPAHERWDPAYDGANPGVDGVYAFERSVYAGVQHGIGGTQHGSGGIDAVPQNSSAGSTSSQSEQNSSTRANQFPDQGPVACAAHLGIVVGLEEHVQCVGACNCAECAGGEEQQGQAAQRGSMGGCGGE